MLSGSKRPRKKAGKPTDDNEDPYIYTAGVVLRGGRRRKMQEDNDLAQLDSVHSSQDGFGHKPHTRAINPRKLPPKDFGAQLFAHLKGDSDEEQLTRRRRAFTEMDDLLDNDIRSGEQIKADQSPGIPSNKNRSEQDGLKPRDIAKEK